MEKLPVAHEPLPLFGDDNVFLMLSLNQVDISTFLRSSTSSLFPRYAVVDEELPELR